MDAERVPQGSPLTPSDAAAVPTFRNGGGGGFDRLSVGSTGSTNSIRSSNHPNLSPSSPPKATAPPYQPMGAAYGGQGGSIGAGGVPPRYTSSHRDRERSNNNNNGTSATTQTDSAPLYRCGAVNKEGASELLCEWTGVPFCAATYGNIAHFCDTITPHVPAKVSTSASGVESASFRMCDLWMALDNPYAFEVPLHPVHLAPHKAPETVVYYTPSLSGFQFYCSIDGMNDICANAWFATEKPELRPCVLDQVELLRGEYPDLWSKRNTDFSHKSWFALLWQPVYCHNHNNQWSAGTFLSLHFIHPVHPSHSVPRPSVVRCDSFVDSDIWTTPHNRLRAERGYTPPVTEVLTCPVFGLVSQRARSDVWYVPTDSSNATYLAPLFLLTAAVQLMSWLEDNDPAWGGKNLADYYHLTKHERNLSDFIATYK
jgi:hypothetical protein